MLDFWAVGQQVVALSSAEAEFNAAVTAIIEAISVESSCRAEHNGT